MTDEPELDLNTLMSLDPLTLTKQNLDKIIAYQRKQRMLREAGGKTKKAVGEAPAVDIKALMNGLAAKPKIVPEPKPAPKGFIRRL